MSRAKDEFLANMSHELRTPITAVLGFAELLEDTDLSEEQLRYLGTIASSTETLLALVDDLLDLARIEAGKVYLAREEFSLRKLIGDVANSQNPAAKAKGLAFHTRVSTEVPDLLMGDSLRLKQVLLNLTVNAIKFSERGEVCLSVAVEKSHPTTPMLRFDVADTGIGIGTENLAGIFQPFSQVDPSSTRKFGGAGLGLAICTKLMAIMGGEISVDSREGVGSTFHVYLPFEMAHMETEGGGAQTRGPVAVTEESPLRVLLVEDHEISQYFFSEVLKRCGHHVELAANGAEALGKLQCSTYDLVLMDVQMPVMDGLEAVSKIREKEQVAGGHLPVIALTAHAMEKDRVEVLSKGFDGYVSKPMKVDVLLDEVRRCIALFQ
jgi:CheY-like chemotaxis protein